MDTNSIVNNQHTFTWKIYNFSLLTEKKSEVIKSSVFIAKSLGETSWCLRVYPRGDGRSLADKMGCFLMRSESCDGPYEIQCEFKIELFSTDNTFLSHWEDSYKFYKGKAWGWYNFSKEKLPNDLNSYDDCLTIRCHLSSKMQEPLPRSESIEVSKVIIDRCSFIWTVKNVNSTTCYETKKLTFNGTNEVELTLQILEDDININIRRTKSLNREYVVCQVTLLDLKGTKQDSKQATHLFESEGNRNESDTWEFPTFLKKSKLVSEKDKFIKDNSFTLKCEISLTNGAITSTIENEDKCKLETLPSVPSIDNFSVLKSGIAQMYSNKIQTDVEIIVEEKVFPAHKFILSAHSPVFMAMFSQDMLENQSSQVNISDLDVKTLDDFLGFLYTGAVRELTWERATKLLLVADKYQVLTLKDECSRFLRSALTDLSVCEVLATADLIKDKSLRDAAVRFIKKHFKDVLKSVPWKRYVKNNPHLASDIICEISTLLAEND